jgi:hypothetical protein
MLFTSRTIDAGEGSRQSLIRIAEAPKGQCEMAKRNGRGVDPSLEYEPAMFRQIIEAQRFG